MPRILIVDDEPSIVLALKDELSFEGFEVDSASDGPSGLEKALDARPDVILLDLGLPGMNGFEICRRVRSRLPEPWIIIVSVRGQEVDRVMGLELGADDYVTKPFSLREIVARIKVGLRRQQVRTIRSVQRLGNLEIDHGARRVLKNGREVGLTRTEFEILELLVARAGDVITRDEFLDSVWGKDIFLTPRVVDTHVAALRKKIEDDPDSPTYIASVRGIGYKLDQRVDES